jgi:hypothetical protein
MAVTIEQLADAMYELVKQYAGQRQFTARELTKSMIEKFGDEADRRTCKEAVRMLIDSGRCIYTYKGSSYVELPQKE